jgi:hypothetical protein
MGQLDATCTAPTEGVFRQDVQVHLGPVAFTPGFASTSGCRAAAAAAKCALTVSAVSPSRSAVQVGYRGESETLKPVYHLDKIKGGKQALSSYGLNLYSHTFADATAL